MIAQHDFVLYGHEMILLPLQKWKWFWLWTLPKVLQQRIVQLRIINHRKYSYSRHKRSLKSVVFSKPSAYAHWNLSNADQSHGRRYLPISGKRGGGIIACAWCGHISSVNFWVITIVLRLSNYHIIIMMCCIHEYKWLLLCSFYILHLLSILGLLQFEKQHSMKKKHWIIGNISGRFVVGEGWTNEDHVSSC